MSTPPQAPQPFNFSGLPAGLRNYIYTLTLSESGILRRQVRDEAVRHPRKPNPALRAFECTIGPFGPPNVNDPALLYASRQCRWEMGDIFYGMYELHLDTPMEGLPVAVQHFSRAMELTGRAMPFAALRVEIEGFDWANLELLFPLLDLIRSEGFSSQFQLVVGSSNWASVPAAVPRRALRLAVRAGREQWSAAKLRGETTLWAKSERSVSLARVEMAAETIRRKFRISNVIAGNVAAKVRASGRGREVRGTMHSL